MEPGLFTPDPGPASWPRMLLSQTAIELKLTLRHGEQLLLNLIIPVLLTVVLVTQPFVEIDTTSGLSKVDFLVPGILALAVMSAAFTGLAIATGFERRYGVLKRLGATPLPRWGLLGGKTLAVAGLEVIQIAVISGVGVALGWRPRGNPLTVAVLVILGTAAFAGLGLLMAGSLRAEATLAAANVVWFLLLFAGGIIFPLSSLPGGVADVLGLLPSAALADGLRSVLGEGEAFPVGDALTLAAWAAASLAAASRYFRWE
ncbi:ABC transporter permease [Cryptosporangium phraense]|uniref:ABC transporter permease n=1 Tax=Cryptosporangium phraense TaxID=2593070 RepID=A0A545AM41_9ACTN|nr:ABC transporter permease [Cryptosporangium phraense]